jgi:hypothetical protein
VLLPSDSSGSLAYIDTDTTVKFAFAMVPANQTWWWYFGDPSFVGQQLVKNKASMIELSPCLLSTTNSITINTYPNISGLNGTADLTIDESGSYSFSGGWNHRIGAPDWSAKT